MKNCSTFNILSGTFFLKNLVWMKELHPGTSKIGFLVKNYVYSLIPRSVALHHEDLRSAVNTREHFRFYIKNRILKLRFSSGILDPG